MICGVTYSLGLVHLNDLWSVFLAPIRKILSFGVVKGRLQKPIHFQMSIIEVL